MQVHPSRLQQVPDQDRQPQRYPRDDDRSRDRRPSPSYDHYNDRDHRAMMYPPRDTRRLTPERELGGGGGGGYPPRGAPDYGYGGGYGGQQGSRPPPQQRQGQGGRDEFFEASVHLSTSFWHSR